MVTAITRPRLGQEFKAENRRKRRRIHGRRQRQRGQGAPEDSLICGLAACVHLCTQVPWYYILAYHLLVLYSVFFSHRQTVTANRRGAVQAGRPSRAGLGRAGDGHVMVTMNCLSVWLSVCQAVKRNASLPLAVNQITRQNDMLYHGISSGTLHGTQQPDPRHQHISSLAPQCFFPCPPSGPLPVPVPCPPVPLSCDLEIAACPG